MRWRTQTNGKQVEIYGNLQADSRAGGQPRTVDHFRRMAAAYAVGGSDTLSTPLTPDEHLSVEDRPLLIIDASHIAPMPLHLTLGITFYLLRLGIEAVDFFGVGWHPRPSTHMTSLARSGTQLGSPRHLTSMALLTGSSVSG